MSGFINTFLDFWKMKSDYFRKRIILSEIASDSNKSKEFLKSFAILTIFSLLSLVIFFV